MSPTKVCSEGAMLPTRHSFPTVRLQDQHTLTPGLEGNKPHWTHHKPRGTAWEVPPAPAGLNGCAWRSCESTAQDEPPGHTVHTSRAPAPFSLGFIAKSQTKQARMSQSLLSKHLRMPPERMIPRNMHAKYRKDTNPVKNMHRTRGANGAGGESGEDKTLRKEPC